jgi:hypothetical protein
MGGGIIKHPSDASYLLSLFSYSVLRRRSWAEVPGIRACGKVISHGLHESHGLKIELFDQ